MIKRVFNPALALFLAVVMTISAVGPYAYAVESEDEVQNIWDRLLTSKTPLSLEYRAWLSGEWRNSRGSLMTAMERTPAGRLFPTFYRKLAEQFEDDLQVEEAKLFEFYAETYRLMYLLKTAQPEFAEKAYASWLDSLFAVDFRRLNKLQFQSHMAVLEITMSQAMLSLGAWTVSERQRYDEFMLDRPEVGPKNKDLAFSAFLQRNQLSPQDPRSWLYIKQGMLIGSAMMVTILPMALGVARPIYNYLDIDFFTVSGFLFTGAYGIATLVSSLGSGIFVAVKAAKQPALFPFERLKRSSILSESKKLLKCESLLDGKP